MNLQSELTLESCQRVEAVLREVRLLLRDPRPEILDQCRGELAEAAALLNSLVSAGLASRNAAIRRSLYEIKCEIRRLKPLIEHASNFCRGWIQGCLGTSYSEHGLPVLLAEQSTTCFEG